MKSQFDEFLKKAGVVIDSERARILKVLEDYVQSRVIEEVSKRIAAFEKTPAEWFEALNNKIDKIKYGFSRIEMAPGVGVGDMTKAVYDTNDDGVVDNSEKLEGSTKAQVQDHAPKSHGNEAHTKIFIEGSDVPANETDPNVDASLKGVTLTQVRDHAPKAHKTSHEAGGADEIDLAGLGGATVSITFIIDGGGSAITTGEKGHLRIPFACEIERVTLLADQSGSIVIDIWKDTYANFPPTDADSITASAPPTISSAQKSEDSTLTGWTKTISAGDILAFNVDSCSTITRVTLALKVKKT